MIARLLMVVSIVLFGAGVFWFVTEYADVRTETITKQLTQD